jgi:two-component system sensor histidine kinase YesM
LEYIRCYMEIQSIRLGDKIDFNIDVSDTILNYYILKLTLQPFVENAVLHGLHGVQRGKIMISAIETTDGVLFIVSDNGQGMREDWKDHKQRETGGYGIRNVQERIDAYFSNKYGIRFESELGKGTEVCILLPKIENSHKWRDQNVEGGNH